MAHFHSHSTHDESHSHKNEPEHFNVAFAIAVSLNLIYCIVQAGYAFAAHSMSLLADAGHNFGDVFGLIMAWGANWLLSRDASTKYSYGFKKTTMLAALANSLILVGGAALIAYESIIRLLHPVSLNEPIIIIVALAGIIVNGSTALLFLKGSKKDLNIKGAFLHLIWDAMVSVGVVVAGTIIFFSKWLWVDPLAGLFIVLVILIGTWDLLRESVNSILDAVPHPIEIEEVKTFLKSFAGVEDIHDLHIWGLSTQEVALTAHLIMPNSNLTDHDHEEINQALRAKFNIKHVTLQVENGHLQDPCGQVSSC